MSKPRNFDEHLRLYVAFGKAVSSFDIVAWKRITARCAAFDDNSVFAIIDRARLSALPHEFPTSRFTSATPIPLRVLSGVLHVVQTSIFLGYELSQQFPELRDEPPARRRASTGNRRTDRYIDAHYDVETALASLARPSAGVRAAVRAAGAAVLHHDFLDANDFARSYFAVAPELPFAELEARAVGESV